MVRLADGHIERPATGTREELTWHRTGGITYLSTEAGRRDLFIERGPSQTRLSRDWPLSILGPATAIK
jgi:hypothetical protein